MNKEEETELEMLIKKDENKHKPRNSIKKRFDSLREILMLPVVFFILCLTFKNSNIDIPEFVVKILMAFL